MRREQHYDPIVQSGPPPPVELPPIRGIIAGAPGTYLLAGDVVAVLLRMAEQEHGEGRVALLAAVDVFSETEQLDAADELEEPPGAPDERQAAAGPPPDGICGDPSSHGAHDWQTGVAAGSVWFRCPGKMTRRDVARVEVYPAGDPRLQEEGVYWHARAVDHAGVIVEEGVRGVNREGVLADAAARWTGAPVHEIADQMGDSIADEQPASTTFNGQRRPSATRLWGRS